MNLKGQGALEYLLLIGGAVLVAAIVIALVTGIPSTVTNPEALTYCGSQPTFVECSAVTCLAPFTAGDLTTWSCAPKQTSGAAAVDQATFARCGAGIKCS